MGYKTSKFNTNKNRKSRLEPSVITALIAASVSITVALLSFPPIVRYFTSEPTLTMWPTSTAIEPSAIIFATESPMPKTIITDTPLPIQPTVSLTITATESLGLPTGMQVILVANQTNGKVPLIVKFDARDSYLRSVDGTIYECGACNYTWSIRQGTESKFGPEKTEGTLEYRFAKKGTYVVTVVVCRNSSDAECGGTGRTIEVK